MIELVVNFDILNKNEINAEEENMLNKGKNVIIILGVFVLLNFAVMIFFVIKNKGYFKSGNASKYNLHKVTVNEQSPLRDKRIIFLGSSVTKGEAAFGCSFVDYLERLMK